MGLQEYISIAYLIAAVCFIYGLKMLSHPRTARNGNFISSFGMLIAIIATLVVGGVITELSWIWVVVGLVLGSIIGAFFAIKVQMTQMPQLVAIFNGFGGGASAFVAAESFGTQDSMFVVVSVVLIPSESFIFVYLLTNGGVGVMYCVTSILSKNA